VEPAEKPERKKGSKKRKRGRKCQHDDHFSSLVHLGDLHPVKTTTWQIDREPADDFLAALNVSPQCHYIMGIEIFQVLKPVEKYKIAWTN
jgi:hypothetical protein